MNKTIFVVAATLFSSQLHAQQDTLTTLQDVVVTANKINQKQNATGKVVQVITQKQIAQQQGKTVTELLNFQTGLFINGANNTLGTNQDLYLRGAATGNTLILIDGVPVGDASQINNTFDLNSISLNQIERIEILKGAQSTLWGSDAVAGVINIITKKSGAKKFQPNAMLTAGSYETYRAQIGFNGNQKDFYYSTNYQFTSSKGFSSAADTLNKGFDKDGFKQHNLHIFGGVKISEKLRWENKIQLSFNDADIDAGAYRDDRDYTFNAKNHLYQTGLFYKNNHIQWQLTQTILSNKRLFLDDSIDIGGFAKYAKGSYNSTSSITELFGSKKLNTHLSIIAGAQLLAQQTDQHYKSISTFGPFETALGDSAKANNLSIYASAIYTNNKFTLEAGIRSNYHSIYGNNQTFSFNPSFLIDASTRVFINISSAYKIPSLYQLYSQYGNKDLKPESSYNYEFGVHHTTEQSNFRVVAFKRDIKDVIVFYTSPSFQSYYINRDQQNDYGIEVENTFHVGQYFSWTSNFTYVDGEGKINNSKVKNLYRRPNFTMNSIAQIRSKNWTISPAFRLVGSRIKGQFDPGPTNMPSYHQLDLTVNYTASQKVNCFADFRNLTNQEYMDIPGYTSRKFNFTVGVQFNW